MIKAKLFFAILSQLLLFGCGGIQYVNYGKRDTPPAAYNTNVEFRIYDAFYADPPNCILVNGQALGDNLASTRPIETSLERHLLVKVNRVIGPGERDHLLRRLAMDLSHPGDLKRFSTHTDCHFQMKIEPWGSGSTNALFWSERRVGFTLKLLRTSDKATLWKSRHVAHRSEGSLPLSPISAPISAYQAIQFQADKDIPLSLTEDVIRRMVSTLPDVRTSGFHRNKRLSYLPYEK
jgi:hypothetical protein